MNGAMARFMFLMVSLAGVLDSRADSGAFPRDTNLSSLAVIKESDLGGLAAAAVS